MNKFYMAIRKITVAPLMAAFLLIFLRCMRPSYFGDNFHFVYCLIFLTVLPLLAYPLQQFIPGFKDRGRTGQRSLAIVFAVLGYLSGCIFNLFFKSTKELWIIFLEYLFSGILIAFINKCMHLKISGHACGIGGPLALLVRFGFVQILLPGILLLLLVYVSSLKTKRHTLPQLIGGTIVPVAVILPLHFL